MLAIWLFYMSDSGVQSLKYQLEFCFSDEESKPIWNEILCLGAKLGDFALVEEALSHQADINGYGFKEPRYTPLMHAIAANHHEMCTVLLEKGANVDRPSPSKVTPLHIAMDAGNLAILTLLLDKKVNVNAVDANDFPPIYTAVVQGFNECVKKAVTGLDSLEFRDNFSRTLLHIALDNENIELASILLAHPSAHSLRERKDIYGRTPLDIALSKQMGSLFPLLSEHAQERDVKAFSIEIHQDCILEKFKKYLALKGRKNSFLNELGNCNGWAMIAALSANGRVDEFYKKLELLAAWDERVDTLRGDAIVFSAERYENLEDLFEQMINDVAWFAHDPTILKPITKLEQYDRQSQYQLISDKKIVDELYILRTFSKEELVIFIHDLQAHPGKSLLLSNPQHAISISILPNGEFFYYDPNFSFRMPAISSAEKVVDLIQKTYCKEYGLDNKSMNLSFNIVDFSPIDDSYRPVNETFISHFLQKTKAYKLENGLDESALKNDLIVALSRGSLQTVRQLLNYVDHEKKWVDYVATRETNYTSNIIIYLVESGYLDEIPTSNFYNRKNTLRREEIRRFYQQHPPSKSPQSDVYQNMLLAIEKNNHLLLKELIQTSAISLEERQNLLKIAVLTEKTDSIHLLKSNYPDLLIKKEYINYSKNIENNELRETLASFQKNMTSSARNLFFNSLPSKQQENTGLNNKTSPLKNN